MTYATSQIILFDASASFDTDGKELTFFWSSNISGYLGEGENLSLLLEAGDHRITLWVSNGEKDGSTFTDISVASPVGPDTDNDGIIDLMDAFPLDPAASKDSDGDGYPDKWNPGKSSTDSTTDLIIDSYPFDPMRHLPEDETESFDQYSLISISAIIIVSFLVIGALATLVVIKKRGGNHRFPGDVRRYGKMAVGEKLEGRLSREERRERLKEAKKKGKISEKTYMDIEMQLEDLEGKDGGVVDWNIGKGKLCDGEIMG
jgi:hypothetical protein